MFLFDFLLTPLLYLSNKRYQSPINTLRHQHSVNDTPKSTDQITCQESPKPTKSKLHQWVYDLKNLDTGICEYSCQSLIIVREKINSLSQLCWDKIVMLPITKLQSSINEVIIIPRSSHGQLYIVQGLRTSLHFSLGPIGTKAFTDHFNNFKIHICTMNRIESSSNIPAGIHVKTVDASNISRTEQGYKQLMIDMSAHLLEELFKVRFLPFASKFP